AKVATTATIRAAKIFLLITYIFFMWLVILLFVVSLFRRATSSIEKVNTTYISFLKYIKQTRNTLTKKSV
ncbi:hypothetical protein HMPREF2533_04522, partial [Bacteroides fragilis]